MSQFVFIVFHGMFVLRLFLVDVQTGTKQTLLVKVSFVQWVIQSDVVVAQTGSNVVIWYNVDMADHLTTFAIQGDVAEIVREQVGLLRSLMETVEISKNMPFFRVNRKSSPGKAPQKTPTIWTKV